MNRSTWADIALIGRRTLSPALTHDGTPSERRGVRELPDAVRSFTRCALHIPPLMILAKTEETLTLRVDVRTSRPETVLSSDESLDSPPGPLATKLVHQAHLIHPAPRALN